MKTTVAVVNTPGEPFVFEEVEVDGPRADEVLVRIVATGLCDTDISLPDTLLAAWSGTDGGPSPTRRPRHCSAPLPPRSPTRSRRSRRTSCRRTAQP
ncbi:hypothetical protein [Nocardioides endophyticus]|uniref:hypothetical protein n=1 Tax=Nocardioides endophyticus TaxID=1353775 RepID=UPI0031F1A2EF